MGATRNLGYIENLISYDASDNIGIGGAVNVLYKVTINGNTLASGTLNIGTVTNAGTDTDKFLVQDANGTIRFRTGAELASDIGASNLASSVLKHQVKLGEAVSKGQAVYVSSSDGTNMIVSKASNASESTSSKTLGLLETGGALNAQVNVITEGLLAGLDTSTANAGDPVWLGTNGNLIFGLINKPYAPAHLVFIGVVTRVQQNNGEIFVKVQNGFELKEIHDIQITSTPSDNQVLTYETATSLYKMKTVDGANVTGYALTKTDDTNVTLTLGGSASTSLLRAASLTLGWTGTLAATRGGTGIGTYTLGDILYSSAANTLAKLAGNTTTTKQYLSQTGDGTVSAAPTWATIVGSDVTGAALTKSDDTNVTLTLGGSASNALLRAASLTLGWTGQLAISRGGTGLSVLGTAGQLLRVNSGATALEYWTPTYISAAITSLNGLTGATQTFATGTTGTDFTISSSTTIHTFNLPTASATNRGALSSTDWSTFNSKQNAITLTTTGSSGASTFISSTLNIPTYTLSGLGGVPTTRIITINGTAQDLSVDRTWSVGTVTSVSALTIGTTGTDITSTVATGTTTPVITINIPTASATNRGALSSADWSTFNSKQNTITLTTTGTSGAATLVGSTLNIPNYTGGGTTLNGTGFVRMAGTTVSYITGTSSQFVKADGSLDSNTYVTGGPYLPLAGGTLSGILYSTYNTASGRSNLSFNVSSTLLGNIHIQNGAGGGNGSANQAAITFMGSSTTASQAGIYVLNDNSNGTSMGFATTESYATGPQLFMTATNNGVVNFPRAVPTYAGTSLVYNSGTWSINVTGSAGSVDFNNLTNKTGGTGTYQTSGDFRAPVFYDSNDTGYYVDPNSYSSLFGLAIRGDANSTGTQNQITFWGGSMTTTSAIGFKANGGNFPNPTGNGDGYNTYLTMDTDGRGWVFRRGTGGTDFSAAYTSGWILNNGIWQANSSMRAPIFYDSNDTSYYVDPNGSSSLNQLTTETRARWGKARWWMSRQGITSDQNYWTGTNGWGTDYGTWANAWRGGFSGWDIWGTGTDHPQGGGYVHAQGIVSGQHYATSDGGSAYGWMMVGAHNATDNRYWLRGKWGGTTSGWVEMVHSGNIGSQSVNYASSAGNSSTTSQREFNYLRINSNNNLYLDYNYGCSIVGVYTSTRYQGVFAMGDAYKLPIDGTSTGNLYGMCWSHPNAGGVAGNLNTHGLLVLENGTFLAAISGSIRARDNMMAPIYYDRNDTAKYLTRNTSSYGSWYMGGSNNGYSGWRVDGGMNLMIHTNGVGAPCGFFHESNGWSILTYTNSSQYLYHNTSEKFRTDSGGVVITGTLYATGDVIAFYSDIRLKKDIVEIDSAVDKIKKLRGVTYTWNDNEVNIVKERAGTRDIGLIAQEVEAIEPLLITEYETQLNTPSNNPEEAANFKARMSEKYKTIKYDKLVALLVEGMKEQQKQIEELKSQIKNK